MKTITETQKYRLKKSIASKKEIIGDEYYNPNISFNFQSIKKNSIEDVCAKLKNDLKWYKDDVFSNVIQNEKKIQENIIAKKISENTASKLVEEWWLGS